MNNEARAALLEATGAILAECANLDNPAEVRGWLGSVRLLRERAGAPPAEEAAVVWEQDGKSLFAHPARGVILGVHPEKIPPHYQVVLTWAEGGIPFCLNARMFRTQEAAQEAAERLWRRARPLIEGLEGDTE